MAAPLRRFGAYTISDFAEARLGSPRLRLLSALVVLGIAGFYLVPQLKGAGLTLREVTGAPYWVGVVAVGAIVAVNVASGGMRGITYVQAFQYWTKTFAIALPGVPAADPPGRASGARGAVRHRAAAGAGHGADGELDESQRVTFPEATPYAVDGREARATEGEERALGPGEVTLPGRAVVPVAEGTEAQTGGGLGAAGLRRLGLLARVRLLAAAGHLPGDDGAPAHPRALLHEPGRAGRAAHHGPRARAARDVLRVPGVYGRSGGRSCPSCT